MSFIKKIFFIISLFGITSIALAQTSEAALWYQKLDIFLKSPSPEALLNIEKETLLLTAHAKDVQLAQVITYCNLGYYAQKYNRLNQAVVLYEKAKNIFFDNQLSNYDIIEYCLKPLGNLYTKTNSFAESESTIKQYLLLAQQQQNKSLEIAALHNLSVVYKSQGLYDKAIMLLNQALEYNPNNLSTQLQLIENNIFKGDIKQAEEKLQHLENKFSNVSKIYVLRSKISVQNNQFYKAEISLLKAIDLEQKTPNISQRNKAKLYLQLAEIQVLQNDLKKATKNSKEIYRLLVPRYDMLQESPEISQLYAENTLLDGLDLQAHIATLQNQPEQAILFYEKADYVSELLFTLSSLQQSKIAQQTHRKNRFEKVLNLLFDLYKATGGTHWMQQALAVDARSKSFVITRKRMLQIFLNSHLEDTLVQQYFKLDTQLEHANNALLGFDFQDNTNTLLLYQIQDDYSNAVTQQRSAFQQLKNKYPVLASQSSVFSIQKIQKKLLSTHQTVVSYFFGSKSVFKFQVSKHSVVFNRIIDSKKQRDSLFSISVRMNHFFENSSVINNQPQEYLDTAYNLFLQLDIPDRENLVIIPDGVLSFIPFGALVTATTTFTNFRQVPFLISRSNVSYRLSLSDFLFENPSVLKGDTNILGVFPQFKDSDKELVYSGLEAEVISEHFKTKLLIDSSATTQEFLKHLNNFDVIHLSTHARGGSFASPPEIEFIDGTLYLNNLYGKNLTSRLVVLSACETGVGRLIKGEGVINLARGFTYSGVQNVLFSLWNVNDYSASWLMQDYYRQLSEMENTTEALTFSKRNYLQSKEIENAKKSPFYWASFVYYGEGITLLPDKPSNWFWISILFISFVLIFLFFLKNKRS